MPHPGIASRQLLLSVAFINSSENSLRTVFHEMLLTSTDGLSFLFLSYLNLMSSSLLFGLGLMSDNSTLSFFKHWHTLRPFPVHWNFAGTPGVIKNECQQAKHLPDSSLRTSGYRLSELCNLKLFIPNSCCLSFFSAMHWRALYHLYGISTYHLFLFKYRTKILIELFCMIISCFTSSI